MHKNIANLFDCIWQDYIAITPSAQHINALFSDKSDVVNDHVAYRTFNIDKVNIDKIAKHFIKLGYQECGEYRFEQKKLKAKHFEHVNERAPKVFISELLVDKFSPQTQAIIHKIVDKIPTKLIESDKLLYSGRGWSLSSAEYELLLNESEYAAWLAVWGYRANHFTVSVNHLQCYNSLEAVNEKVKSAGYLLNTSGGEIKGNKDVMLEQSSTMADTMSVDFSDKRMSIPSCFYEFAKRYHTSNGKIYTGFVAASADKIFESTNT